MHHAQGEALRLRDIVFCASRRRSRSLTGKLMGWATMMPASIWLMSSSELSMPAMAPTVSSSRERSRCALRRAWRGPAGPAARASAIAGAAKIMARGREKPRLGNIGHPRLALRPFQGLCDPPALGDVGEGDDHSLDLALLRAIGCAG